MKTALNILLIEDSEDDAFLLLRELSKGGYEPHVERVETEEVMRQALARQQWDVITSDYNMPQFSALEALRILQESGIDLPFIVVSGKIGEDLAVAAMKAGAHDYVMKNNLSRLVPAIDRELREAEERRKRRQAEIALKNQFSQISTIFDSMNAVVYVADLETYELLYMNKYGSQLFGGNWQNKSCYTVLQTGRVSPCAFCTNDQLLRDGKPSQPLITEFQSSVNGTWYQCLDRIIEWPDGRLVRMEIAIDITERKEMERLKDEMISAVSHEMRTPLTAMMGFTEFLLDNEVSREQLVSHLQTIHKETERLNNLIGNFLDLQKLKNRQDDYELGLVSVDLLLKEAAALFAAEHHRHKIVVDCPPGLPSLRGDEAKLHQVMTNLISNACKYSPQESRIVVGACAGQGEVILYVQDEGPGIPVEVRDKIFEKFYRIDNSDRRKVGGTGLGLALVKEIVTTHGGRVWVESSDGRGCTFSLALPVACPLP
jgi:two-component system phosphate regulon sensor histidine kinase PhoR